MEIKNLLAPNAVLAGVTATDKKQLLQQIALTAAGLFQLDQQTIFSALLQRERLGTTGLGNGIAVPHARIAGIDRLHGIFLKLETPISFDAVDENPVDLLFAIFAPEEAGADHLKALVQITRLMRAPEMAARLRQTASASSLHALLTSPLLSQAA